MNKRKISKIIAIATVTMMSTSIIAPEMRTNAMVVNQSNSVARQIIEVDEEKFEVTVNTQDPNRSVIILDGVDSDEYTKIEYDREKDILITNGVEHDLQTKVTLLDPSLGLTEVDILEAEKAMSKNDTSSRAHSVSSFLPSNVAVVNTATISRNLPNYYGKLESALNTMAAAATAAIVFGAPLPGASTLLGALSAATGLTGYAMGQLYGECGGTYTYTQQRTRDMHKIGYITTYAYRTKNSSLKYYITFGGKTYNTINYTSGTGSWWTSQKPY